MSDQLRKWVTTSLEAIAARIDYGHTASADEAGIGPKFLRITDIQNGHVDWDSVPYCQASTEEIDQYRLRCGDIVFARTGATTGKSFLIEHCPEDTVFASYLIRVRPGPTIEPRFLARFFDTANYWAQIRKHAKGAGQPGVNATSLKSLEIPLPPLPEQKRIADILDKADAIRRKRREAITHSDNLLPSLFCHMFGPGGNKYEPETLGNHLEFLTSGSRGWAEHYVQSGKRFIRSLDVQMNRIGSDEAVFVNPPRGTEAERTRVRDGDVLITITGSRIGRVAFVPESFGEAYVSQHVAIVRLKPSLMPRFCSMFLSLPNGGQRQIAKAQYGQTKPGIGLTNIRDFQIPLPPTKEQDRFLKTWDQLASASARQAKSGAQCEALFQSLVQRAFRGEL